MPTPFPEPQPLLLTVEHFGALIDAGAFAETGKTELIEGVIVHMNPEYARNVILRNELTFRFHDALRALNSPYRALGEPSVSLPPRNMPSPDMVGVEDRIVRRFWSSSEQEYIASDEIALEGELQLQTMPEIAIDGRGIL